MHQAVNGVARQPLELGIPESAPYAASAQFTHQTRLETRETFGVLRTILAGQCICRGFDPSTHVNARTTCLPASGRQGFGFLLNFPADFCIPDYSRPHSLAGQVQRSSASSLFVARRAPRNFQGTATQSIQAAVRVVPTAVPVMMKGNS